MNEDFLKLFKESLQTGYINKEIESEVLYQPKLLVNNKIPRKKVLTSILKEFEKCTSYYISVAFVTTGGVAAIINTLQSLEERNIRGKVLVSQYLNFTQPEALERLLQFEKIDLRIATTGASHAKGYIFETKEYYNLIIGSSNLTQNALATNKEWNLQVSALRTSKIANKVISEFERDFEEGTVVNKAFIADYRTLYDKQRLFKKQQGRSDPTELNRLIKPNLMQEEALANLHNFRIANKNKALVISATGTGKTYLAAFDVKSFNPKRMLFVVHRLNIAKKAMETFQEVFKQNKTMGLYSGSMKETDKDFVFSTVQTISKEAHLKSFARDQFDYIIIDESHRSGAKSYRTLIEYFAPQFLLGMTATPERTDGNDIFELFDYNIAYEIRLNRAMEEGMLSPFHYYGVSDLFIDSKEQDDLTLFNNLTSDERVIQIIQKTNFYGTDNGIARGLIFCSKIEEAATLSRKFNQKGFKTIALSGSNSEAERITAIQKLESDNLAEMLDYIFTVDIFNEGIDIPKVNQIVMLRPTKSAIVFIQQLGRGLRKLDDKSYLTVIDFIGNHNNNFLIPMALYGDSSYNKDKLRKLISEGSKELPGVSTINFDRISKEKIFKSIDSANMKLLKELKSDYTYLKNRLGRIPMMMDFVETETRDPFLYVEYSKSYFNFVAKVEKVASLKMETKAIKLLEHLSRDVNNAKRVEESFILQELLENDVLEIENIQAAIFKTFDYRPTLETIYSAIDNINLKFIREKKDRKLLPVNEILQIDVVGLDDGKVSYTEAFNGLLGNEVFRSFFTDTITFSIKRFRKLYAFENYDDGFILYGKYSRKDVFRILNYQTNPVAQNVGGYLVSEDFKNCPIFVNYHKEENISESTKYEDEFVNNSTFSWMSKSNRKLASKDVVSILGENGEIRLPLFVKKNNDEGVAFYYMGNVSPDKEKVSQTTIKNNSDKDVSVVKILFKMERPVSDSMYNYLLETISSSSKESPVIPLERKFKLIPLFNFYAAAGSFSEIQSDKNYEMIEVAERFGPDEYFACEIKGESMNRRIPNGAVCIFKRYTGGSRNGKIVLVEHLDIQDPDFNSAFTIKVYTSTKEVSEDGWKHTSIVLRPNSFDVSYEDIVIDEESGGSMRVIGEFVGVVE